MTNVTQTPYFYRFVQNEHVALNYFALFQVLSEKALPLLEAQLENDSSDTATTLRQILSNANYSENKYRFKSLQEEIQKSRLVDNFHSYLMDILRAYLRGNPSKLPKKTKSKIRPRKSSGMGKPIDPELEARVIDEAENLMSKGLTELMGYLKTSAGLAFDVPEDILNDAEFATATRNIIAHNRGRTSHRFANKFKDDNLEIDLPMIPTVNDEFRFMYCLTEIAKTFDLAFIRKYGVEMFTAYLPYATFTEGVRFGS